MKTLVIPTSPVSLKLWTALLQTTDEASIICSVLVAALTLYRSILLPVGYQTVSGKLFCIKEVHHFAYDHHEPEYWPRSAKSSGFWGALSRNLSCYTFSMFQSTAVEKWFLRSLSVNSMDNAHRLLAVCHIEYYGLLCWVLSCFSSLCSVFGTWRCCCRVLQNVWLDKRHDGDERLAFDR